VINDLIKIRFNGISSAKRIKFFEKHLLKSLQKDIEEDYDYGENMELAGILLDPPPQPEGFDQGDQPDQHDI